MVAISTTLPEGEPARTITPEELPPAWSTEPLATRRFGDAWMRSCAWLAFEVPSVPIRSEWNVLVNPHHRRVSELCIDPPQPFVFDARMFERTGGSSEQVS